MEQKKVVKKVVKKPVVEKKENKFLDTIKKNWKNILLIVLLLFSLSKCTSSCTRAKKIDKLNYQIEIRDSIINANGIELDKLSTRLQDAKESNDAYKGIATGNQKEMIEHIEKLTNENRTLSNKIIQLEKDNTKLKKQISELEDKLKEVE